MTSDGVDRIVEQWAGERPDLYTTTMAVLGRTFRIARLSGDATEQVYRRFDMSRPEFDVLATPRRSGAPYELSPGALASSHESGRVVLSLNGPCGEDEVATEMQKLAGSRFFHRL